MAKGLRLNGKRYSWVPSRSMTYLHAAFDDDARAMCGSGVWASTGIIFSLPKCKRCLKAIEKDSVKCRRASVECRRRYLKQNAMRTGRKENRTGIIGISHEGASWIAKFPPWLGMRSLRARTAAEAAGKYNRQMFALFGEDAVLCDVQAAMELDNRRCK